MGSGGLLKGAQPAAKEGCDSDRLGRSGDRRRRARRPGTGPAERGRRQIVMDEPRRCFVRPRSNEYDDRHDQPDGGKRQISMAGDAQGAVGTMPTIRTWRLVAAKPVMRSGVTDFAGHGDRRHSIAARKRDASVRRKHEGQGLQNEKTSDQARENPACKTSRQGPNHRHVSMGKPLTSHVNTGEAANAKYPATVVQKPRIPHRAGGGAATATEHFCSLSAVTLHESVRLSRFRRAAAGNGETKNGLASRICCKYEFDGWASASSLVFTASNRMLSRPLRESGSVANFLCGRERPGTMSWLTPPAHRTAALDAIYLSRATAPCGSCA